ncbi:DUF262 domain-containing HNH endonuclease family protein (plasmid) [Entomospira entomophila]|uniref:DUF262 domain-containing protein n=1 Tax=Entomospira entomophila TaxID=2719988 RepID=A0A968KRZ2_9SPIO|nr:DUF262 domain-containing protein [Entomospira entomophilus]NIZ41263.1 DUF262 domain-containing protein [Entomospira entomophilus]WDI36209.1 DUF262 domain-containing HNH endonuclease family protein [Entomospira entomophilus]
MSDDLLTLSILDIFTQYQYIVPIYQRNYAWQTKEIEQLIEDIHELDTKSSSHYFLGNLIVNKQDNGCFEVIDGQQRLTTLFLLKKYLNIAIPHAAFSFEARERSNRTLEFIMAHQESHLILSQEIVNGYTIIHHYFESKNIDKEQFIQKLHNIFLLRVQVPRGIDLNYYFEMMNTRGEQLELHEIAKARFMSVLASHEDKMTAHLIWETCFDMSSYVQMNFTATIRKQIFDDSWTHLKSTIDHFNDVKNSIYIDPEAPIMPKQSLLKILQSHHQVTPNTQKENKEESEENERFESIISFPNFLLQVNAVLSVEEENESNLDDKKLLKNLEKYWQNSESAKQFLFTLLKLRVLFDQYVLKREFISDYQTTGKWSLQKLVKYPKRSKKDDNKPTYAYVSTYDQESGINNRLLRTLQSCLRVTYTSPKTMHWITRLLNSYYHDERIDPISLLEMYGRNKVRESNYQKVSGFGFERITFMYLDYLLYRDGYSPVIKQQPDGWEFQSRSSIEHFYPQHPSEVEVWSGEHLHDFGNLALIQVSSNSKFSNLTPMSKIGEHPSLINQSLKLQVMAHIVRDTGSWSIELVEKHKTAMFDRLDQDIDTLSDSAK